MRGLGCAFFMRKNNLGVDKMKNDCRGGYYPTAAGKRILSMLISVVLGLSILAPLSAQANSTPSSWAVEEVNAAIDANLVTDSVKNDYQANITREQFCEMVVKAYEKISGEDTEKGLMSFNDTNNSEILKAANLGIVSGYGNGIFGPNDLITREQIATMLVRMIDKAVSYANVNVYNSNKFADSDVISNWALPSVNFAYDKEIMQGVGDNKIAPLDNTTCEQAVLLVYRTTQEYTNHSRIFYDDIDNIKINDEENAKSIIKRKSEEIGIKDIDEELVYTRSEDVLGNTFYHFQQIYNDIPVYGRSVTVGVTSSGNAIAISDNYTTIDVDTSIKVRKQDVTEIIEKLYADEIMSFYIKGLTIYSLNNTKANLCWEVNVNLKNDTEVVFISTNDGKIVDAISLTYYDSVVGNGYDIDDNFCKFNTYTEDNKLFYMEDRENGITVYDAENGTLKATTVIVDENNNLYQPDYDKEIWVDDKGNEITVEDGEYRNLILKQSNGSVISKNAYTAWYLHIDKSFLTDKIKKEYLGSYLYDNVFASVSEVTNKGTEWKNHKAVTAMDRISKLNNFYNDIFNRVGYDGKAGGVIAVINDSINGEIENAYSKGDWNGTTLLSFGKNNSLSFDIIGHEYRHSVTASIKDGLIYKSESGALNEAYSDIFGELFEDWVDDKQLNNSCDWIHNNGRNLVNPLESNDPNFYKGANWVDTSDTDNDHGGVHTNQTVISHAAYLMSTGLDIDNSVEHLTNLQLAKLFHTTSYVLPSTCTFEEFSKSLYIIANYMYENNEITEKQLLCVARAFEYVGLPITEQSIFGRVIDNDGNYVDKATVNFSINDVQISSVVTDRNGNFSAKLPVGTYDIRIAKQGYTTATQGATLNINEWFILLDDIILDKKETIDYSKYIGKWNWSESESLHPNQDNWYTYNESWIDIQSVDGNNVTLEFYHQKGGVHLYLYDSCVGEAQGNVIIADTNAHKGGPILAKFRITLTLYEDRIELQTFNVTENVEAFSGTYYLNNDIVNAGNTSDDYDYNKILNGDFSDFATIWRSAAGDIIFLHSDGITGEGSVSESKFELKAENIKHEPDGSYSWNVVSYYNSNIVDGIKIILYPKGVEVISWNGNVVPTDTSQVRLWAGNGSVADERNICYKL